MTHAETFPVEGNLDHSVNFTCNGCGRCCNGHHLPLTLSEAQSWMEAGGQIVIFTEAFHEASHSLPDSQFAHTTKRSALVKSGATHIHVIATFAAFNPERCRNLQDDNRCGIYEVRPLVCRIYPAEINPHIRMNRTLKDCPDEVWQSAERLIFSDGGLSPELAQLIEASRQADRMEANRKVWICQQLGITNAAWKGEGMMAWLPDNGALQQTLLSQADETHLTDSWTITVDSITAAQSLHDLAINASLPSDSSLGAFIAFPK